MCNNCGIGSNCTWILIIILLLIGFGGNGIGYTGYNAFNGCGGNCGCGNDRSGCGC